MKFKMRPWYCYFYLMLGFFLVHCIIALIFSISLQVLSVEVLLLLGMELYLLCGLYGFTRKTPILQPWLWKVAAFIGIIVLGSLFYDSQIPEWIHPGSGSYIRPAIILILTAPWLYGLVMYGFRNEHLWDPSS